jgi:ABC-type glycerol-3-phosphate transport system permease component
MLTFRPKSWDRSQLLPPATAKDDNGTYWHWLVNTLLYAGAAALCATALASAAGYALAKYEFRGRQLAFSVILGGVLVTMFLFQYVAIWNNFFLPLVMLSNTRLYPVTLGLWNNQYGQERFWKSGLAAGSVQL